MNEQYWKCEYENLRRKKNKEIQQMKNNQISFFSKTYKLLKLLGIPDNEILDFYNNKRWNNEQQRQNLY